MTTTDTMDTEATVAQCIRMAESGCEYIRITAPSVKEAQNLEHVRRSLHQKGYHIPLIADIHFTPNAAEVAARIVEKVRVNPGNYVDKKKFEVIEYTDDAYHAEIERIRSRFLPLVNICKEYGTAMRIGTNHGSLSDRILSRYGDTPLGMVESALEFLRICRDAQYHNIVLSMKASNPQVMVQAYRLLVNRMWNEFGEMYPLHLGVTEAGEGEDGRIKSASGIATLLADGIGDTVRVSLTEDPEFEAPVADFMIRHILHDAPLSAIPDEPPLQVYPFEFSRRVCNTRDIVGSDNVPRVIANHAQSSPDHAALKALGYHYHAETDKYSLDEMAADYLYVGNQPVGIELPGALRVIRDHSSWKMYHTDKAGYPYFSSVTDYLNSQERHFETNFVRITLPEAVHLPWDADFGHVVFVGHSHLPYPLYAQRAILAELQVRRISQPVIWTLKTSGDMSFYQDNAIPERVRISEAGKRQLYGAAQLGPFTVDGILDGVWLDRADSTAVRTAFGVLQANRLRITKTEYISCPSCGRTLFDLQETTARIRARTEHLKGVKIGIMGCIVNGPGEMADADYGYVGTGPGKITLYKGKEVVRKNVNEVDAVEALVELIREHGDWVE